MTDPFLSIQYSDGQVRDRLTRLQAKVKDLTPAMKSIGEYLLLSTDQRFEQQLDPNRIPWKADSPYTIAQKRAKGRILKILQDTGRLRASISYSASSDRVVVGTNVKYAAKNQKERPFLGIGDQDRQEIVAILDEFLSES